MLKKRSVSLFLEAIRGVGSRSTFFLVGTIVLLFVSTAASTLAPIFIKQAIDAVEVKKAFSSASTSFVYFCLCLALGMIFSECKFIVYSRWEQDLLTSFASRIYRNVFSKKPAFFRSQRAVSLAGRVFQSISGIKVLLFDAIFHLFPFLVELIIILGSIAYTFDLHLALIIPVGSIIYIVFMIRCNNRLAMPHAELRETFIEAQGAFAELILAWKDIKLTTRENESYSIFSSYFQKFRQACLVFYSKRGTLGLYQGLILAGIFSLANYMALTNYILGNVSIGGLVLLNSYLWMIMSQLKEIGLLYRGMYRSYVDFMSINPILEAEAEACTKHNLLPKIEKISFINFSMNSIRNVSIDFFSGESVAIIGRSGSGKTTLFNAITKLDESFSGEILINEKNIHGYDAVDLRQRIRLFPAEAILLSEDLHTNIYFSLNTKCDKIDKYISHIGIQRQNELMFETDPAIIKSLSDGEKQRIKLLRYILCQGDARIFDESTSSLDRRTERKIVKFILSEFKSDLNVFTMHNWDNLDCFNRIIHLESGGVLFDGTYRDFKCSHEHTFQESI